MIYVNTYLEYLQEGDAKTKETAKGAAQDEITRAMRNRIRRIPKSRLLKSGDTSHELSLALRSIKKVQQKISILRKVKSAFGISLFLLATSSLIYHKYLEKAARECKNQPNVDECIKNYRKKARTEQLTHLKSKKSKCQTTDNPAVCKKKIDEKISSLKRLIKNG